MRFPYGYRPTFAEAIAAARESATMTNMRYRVRRDGSLFTFQPVKWPDPDRHEGVRV